MPLEIAFFIVVPERHPASCLVSASSFPLRLLLALEPFELLIPPRLIEVVCFKTAMSFGFIISRKEKPNCWGLDANSWVTLRFLRYNELTTIETNGYSSPLLRIYL